MWFTDECGDVGSPLSPTNSADGVVPSRRPGRQRRPTCTALGHYRPGAPSSISRWDSCVATAAP
jgi:hypothetical protein